jgi:glutamate dehydrogenase
VDGRRHFTFLGQRDYALVADGDGFALRGVEGSGSASCANRCAARRNRRASLPPAAAETSPARADLPDQGQFARDGAPPGYLDYVGVKLVGADGKVSGERRHRPHTSTAYFGSYADIPIVRRNARTSCSAPASCRTGIRQVARDRARDLSARRTVPGRRRRARHRARHRACRNTRTRLFVRRDRFDRFVSCLAFVPRDKYNTDLRRRIAKLLVNAYNGVNVEFTPLLSESAIARIHFVVHAEPGTMPDVDTRELETRLVQVTRRWQDDLADALLDAFGEEQGNGCCALCGLVPGRLSRRLSGAHRRARHRADRAREGVRPAGDEPVPADRGRRARVPLQGVSRGRPIALSRSLPMLEHLGVRVDEERPYRSTLRTARMRGCTTSASSSPTTPSSTSNA